MAGQQGMEIVDFFNKEKNQFVILEIKKISLLLKNLERHKVKLHMFLRSSSWELDELVKTKKRRTGNISYRAAQGTSNVVVSSFFSWTEFMGYTQVFSVADKAPHSGKAQKSMGFFFLFPSTLSTAAKQKSQKLILSTSSSRWDLALEYW